MKLFFSFIFLVLFFSGVYAQLPSSSNDQQDDDLLTVDEYVQDEHIEEFIALSADEKKQVLSGVDEEKANTLLEKISLEIGRRISSSASGNIAESQGSVTAFGQEKADYPFGVTFKGFGDSDLFFNDESVIGDGSVFLNIEDLPAFTKEVAYEKNDGKSSFVITGEDGAVLRLQEGSTNKEGKVSFIASREGMVGHTKISDNLHDFSVSGEVSLTEEGFVFENKDAKIVLGDDEIILKTMPGAEEGYAKVFDDGFKVQGASLQIEGGSSIVAEAKDKEFLIVLSDDFSSLAGKDYPDSITINDYRESTVPEYVNVGPGAGTEIGEKPSFASLGELKISVDENGGMIFEKDVGSLTERIYTSETNIDDLRRLKIYTESSPTVQNIMEEMITDPRRATMAYLERNLFSDVIAQGNRELYQEFQKTDLSNKPAGIAISSKDSRGNIDVFVNPGDVGITASFRENIDIMDVYQGGSKDFKVNLDPSHDSYVDYVIKGNDIYSVSKSTKSLDVGISELRFRNSDGTYDVNKITKITDRKATVGNGDKLTMYKVKFDPAVGKLFVNNNEVIIGSAEVTRNDMMQNIEQQVEVLQNALDNIDKSEGDIVSISKLLSDLNRNRDSIVSAAGGVLPQAEPYLQQGSALINEDMTAQGISSAELYAENIRRSIEQDIAQFINDPLRVDITATVNPQDIPTGIDRSNTANFINEIGKTPYKVEIGVDFNELETYKILQSISDDVASQLSPSQREIFYQNMDGLDATVNELKEKALTNGLSQLAVQGVIGRNVVLPDMKGYTSFGIFESDHPFIGLPDEIGLRQAFVDDLSNAILQNAVSLDIQGRNTVILENIPNGGMKVSYDINGQTINLNGNVANNNDNLVNPETADLLSELSILAFNAPGHLKGVNYRGVNVYNNPIQNEATITYLRSIGYNQDNNLQNPKRLKAILESILQKYGVSSSR